MLYALCIAHDIQKEETEKKKGFKTVAYIRYIGESQNICDPER